MRRDPNFFTCVTTTDCYNTTPYKAIGEEEATAAGHIYLNGRAGRIENGATDRLDVDDQVVDSIDLDRWLEHQHNIFVNFTQVLRRRRRDGGGRNNLRLPGRPMAGWNAAAAAGTARRSDCVYTTTTRCDGWSSLADSDWASVRQRERSLLVWSPPALPSAS